MTPEEKQRLREALDNGEVTEKELAHYLVRRQQNKRLEAIIETYGQTMATRT